MGESLNITDRRRQLLDQMVAALLESGSMPTLRELMAPMGIQSPNGLVGHLRALCRDGWLTRGARCSRAKPWRLTARTVAGHRRCEARGESVLLRRILPEEELSPVEATALGVNLILQAGLVDGLCLGDGTPELLRRIIEGLARRVFEQSELLTQRAMRQEARDGQDHGQG